MLRTLIFLIALSSALISSAAYAGFYKCLDADGNTTYSQQACPLDQKTAKIISAGSGSSNNDCRIAGFFANKVAKQMRAGSSSGQVFDQYGGMNYIPRTSLALINYIYTFEHNYKPTPERIAALTVARCQSASFGPTSCNDFPPSYIQDAGGCENAEKGLSGYAQSQHFPRAGAANATDGDSESGRPVLQNGQPDYQQQLKALEAAVARGELGNRSTAGGESCRDKQQEKLDKIAQRMRQQSSAAAQDSLRIQKRAARKALNNC